MSRQFCRPIRESQPCTLCTTFLGILGAMAMLRRLANERLFGRITLGVAYRKIVSLRPAGSGWNQDTPPNGLWFAKSGSGGT